MNLQDNQQYIPSAGDNVYVIHIGHIDIKSIQSDVDLYLKELHEEWKASIQFMCYTINENDKPCTSPLGNSLSKIDVCNYLGGQMYPACRLAFCPNTYKPPSSNDEMTSKNSETCNGWTDLQRDLSIGPWCRQSNCIQWISIIHWTEYKQSCVLMWNILSKH
jgi:hypothetical protein